VARAAPDGHTLLFYASTMWILPLLKEGVPYEPLRDFAPITLAATAPNILVVHPQLQANSVRELIALAKSNPGTLNYGVGGSGSSTHLAAELFRSMAGIDVLRVNYKGTGPALNDLMGGRLHLMFATMGAMTQVKAGKLRALAVTGAQASALLPDMPTVNGSGLPGYESATTYGLFAPAKTPTTIVNSLYTKTVNVLQSVDTEPLLLQSGVEPVGSSPAQFAAMIKSDMAKWGHVIKSAGITAD